MKNSYSKKIFVIKQAIIICALLLFFFTTSAQEKDICISVKEYTSISFFDGIEQIIDDIPYTIGYASCSKILREVRINRTICEKSIILLLQRITEGKNLRIIKDGDIITIEEISQEKRIEPETKSGYVNEDKDPELTSISNEEIPLYKEAASQTFIETTNTTEKAMKKTTTFESTNPISKKSSHFIHNHENPQKKAKPKPSPNPNQSYNILSKSPEQKSLIVYSHWSYFTNATLSHIYYANANFGYNGLSVAYKRVNKKSNFLQYELKSGLRRKVGQRERIELVTIYHSFDSITMVNPNPEVVDYRSSRFVSRAKFEFGKHKESRKVKNLSFEYGLALSLFYYRAALNPQTPSNWFYSNKNTEFGIEASLIANLEYDISKHFYLQLNASVLNRTWGGDFSKTDRPDIAEDLKNNGIFAINSLTNQLLRFGVG